MDIQKIDKNFQRQTAVNKDGTAYYDATKPPFALYGVYHDGNRFLRMPEEIASQVNEGVQALCRHTAGGRLRFATDSPFLNLQATYDALSYMGHMALTGSGGFVLCENVGEEERYVATIGPWYTDEKGFQGKADLPADGALRFYTLYFPLYHEVNALTLGFEEGARVREGLAYKEVKPILYYGSSITQGACASRADTCYQGFICKRNQVDYINLGFSGNAKAEPVMIDYLANIDCSVFVFDYDHNAPSPEYLKETHFPAYAQYREKRPLVPIIFASRPNFYRGEGQERLNTVKETYEKALAMGDKNVYFIDGREFYGEEWGVCEVDGTHPTDLGFYKMAQRFWQELEKIFK